ncbi:cupin domain-containing protein [Brucella pseudogrignonensis]|uniref:cupin domain-containing protein n=1 Tax=Brucella pseudogrignonensis TaxID=419475 RepID=UPI0038B6AB04
MTDMELQIGELQIGGVIEAPGFRGTVLGCLEAGAVVIEAEINGEIEAHVSHNTEVAVLLSGCMRVVMQGEERLFRVGEFVIIPKGVEHAVVAEIPSRLLLIGAMD